MPQQIVQNSSRTTQIHGKEAHRQPFPMTMKIGSQSKSITSKLNLQNEITKRTTRDLSTTQSPFTPSASHPGTHPHALHDCITEATYSAPETRAILKSPRQGQQSERAEHRVLS
jgi:hypothetical protein